MKDIPQGRASVFVFTFAYIALFSIGFIYGGNYEFAIYTLVMLAATLLVILISHQIDIPNAMLWALSGMGVLHMLGGGAHINGERLYAHQIWNVYAASDAGSLIFRYDQLVHMLGYAVIAIVLNFALRRTAPHAHSVGRAALAVLAAMAIGSINELAEFFAVLILPSTGVGDYFNTMLDLSFNTLGALLGVVVYETYTFLRKLH